MILNVLSKQEIPEKLLFIERCCCSVIISYYLITPSHGINYQMFFKCYVKYLIVSEIKTFPVTNDTFTLTFLIYFSIA